MRKLLSKAAIIMTASYALSACSLFGSGGVGQVGIVNVDDVYPTCQSIIEVHDEYVSEMEDRELASEFLIQSGDLQLLLDQSNVVPTSLFSVMFDPVATRHDEWVTEDSSLLALERRVALRNTRVIRGYVNATLKQ